MPEDSDWELDAALLDAWRGGDDQSGERLFDRHAEVVARFFENKVRAGAEDLTQATFLRMIESRERIREGALFRAYVLGIARNVLREHLRELARGRAVDPEVDSMASLAPGPSTVAGEKREHRLLLEGLRRLPVDSQLILELFYWESLGSQAIAEIIGVSADNARQRLSRARRRLDETMREIAASHELLESTMQGLEGWAAELRALLGSDEGPPQS